MDHGYGLSVFHDPNDHVLCIITVKYLFSMSQAISLKIASFQTDSNVSLGRFASQVLSKYLETLSEGQNKDIIAVLSLLSV